MITAGSVHPKVTLSQCDIIMFFNIIFIVSVTKLPYFIF